MATGLCPPLSALCCSQGGKLIDTVLLSRIQFGFTAGFHFIFPPLTIGLAWFIFGMMTHYRKTDSDSDRDMVRFWIRMLATTFVVGTATGIAMEFQFGTNWAGYSRFVGDIFGAPLAIESVVAFFLESTFIAVLVLGWDRVSQKMLWFASMMVAVGSTISAFWILVANSWQQTPAGYTITSGHARLTSLTQAVFTDSMWPRFFHTLDGALATASFFVMGISAAYLLRNKNTSFAKSCLAAGVVIAFITSLGQLATGHVHARQVARTQKAKLAAIEGLYDTQRRAPMIIVGIPVPGKENTLSLVEIPKLLSYMAYGNTNAKVKGLRDFPEDQRPPVLPTFISFHVMVGIGGAMIGLSLSGLYLLWRKQIYRHKWFLRAAVIAIPLPFIANEVGWVTAEMGRQPWVVYGVMRTNEAASTNVPAGQTLFSMLMFIVVYAFLFLAWLYMLRREYLYHLGQSKVRQEVKA